MNLYISEFTEGINEVLELYKQGNNIFEIKNGSLFPNVDKQQMWQFSRGPKHLHLHDGQQTYSFGGNLAEEDTDLEKLPDVPLPDLFKDSVTKGKAQVHRSDPGSIYFTLQEGNKNPTYTVRHLGDAKWRAIPKKKTVKAQMAAPAAIPNINVESIKEGMFNGLQEFIKQGGFGDLLEDANMAAGKGLHGGINLTGKALLSPGLIGGSPQPDDDGWTTAGNAAKAGLVGAGLGAGYHFLKQQYYNTPEENQEETGKTLLKRIGIPALGMAGINAGLRDVLPNYYTLAANGYTPTVLG